MNHRVDDMTPLVIIGSGTYGNVIAELAASCGYRVTAYLDDDLAKNGAHLDGIPVSGPIVKGLEGLSRKTAIAAAIGDNTARIRWLHKVRNEGFQTPSLVSPQSIVSPTAKIEEAVYLHPACNVWTQARIGLGSILSPNATVAHHTVLGEGCFVSSGANVGASIFVEYGAFFGMGSITSTGVKLIASRTLVGAGSVIVRDTEERGVYVGSPGRLLRYLEA